MRETSKPLAGDVDILMGRAVTETKLVTWVHVVQL